jgi:hypothetical protein
MPIPSWVTACPSVLLFCRRCLHHQTRTVLYAGYWYRYWYYPTYDDDDDDDDDDDVIFVSNTTITLGDGARHTRTRRQSWPQGAKRDHYSTNHMSERRAWPFFAVQRDVF